MNKRPLSTLTKPIRNAALVLSLALTLGACSSTEQETALIDSACLNDAQMMREHAESIGSHAQLLVSSKTLGYCLPSPIPQVLKDHEKQQIMQIMATITLTNIMAGDIKAAKSQLQAFEIQFPREDLYLPDYTSFIDTAKAIIEGNKLSTQELASLNISRELRQELERQSYWLTH
jgi:hypothetical protein